MLLSAQLAVLVGIFVGACLWVFVMSTTDFLVKLAAIQFDRHTYETSAVNNVLPSL